MKAMRNATNLVILGIWAMAGLVFSLQSLFTWHAAIPVAAYWAWFAAFAAATSWIISKFDSPFGALATHGGAFLALQFVPRAFPFNLLRLGYDLLSGAKMPSFS